MYIPSAFAVDDLPRLHAFVREHSFATLVSDTGGEPFVSHLPLLLDADRGPQGTLVGHFARANDHWRVAAGRRTTAIFLGPHTYISPSWYAEDNVVPTWNYVAVHAAGELRVIDDRDWLLALLQRTVSQYEGSRSIPWRMDSQSEEFIDRLLGAIIGFELPVDRWEGKWKLSQNHSVERRQRVIAELDRSADVDAQEIGRLMSAMLPPR